MSTFAGSSIARAGVRGMLWNYAAFYSGKLMVFVSTVILARLLIQEDFGVAGYALTAIGLLEVLNNLGVGQALIYHRDSPESADTAFWLGIGMAIALFGITWVGAPFVGAFFNDDRAVPVVRVLALTFPIAALGNVHDSLLTKQLAFSRKFLPDLGQALSKGVISMLLALMGFGPWSLVIGQLSGKLIGVIGYWLVIPWRPSIRFDRSRARDLLSYGLGIVAINALAIFVLNLDFLFVGRFLGAAAMGVYTLAFRFPDLLIVQFCYVISSALFPMYVQLRNESDALGKYFVVTTRFVSLLTVPISIGMALVARPFVLMLFGARWADAVPVVQAISLYALFASLSYHAGDVYKAMGRTSALTGLVALRALLLLPALWWAVSVPGTLAAVGWTYAAMTFIASAIAMIAATRLLKTPLSAIGTALAPAILAGALMTPVVLLVLTITDGTPLPVQLIAAIIAGAITYCGVLWLFWRDVVQQASGMLRGAMARRG